MNLQAMILKYMGWCPGVEAASRFRSRTITPVPSLPYFGIISTLAILLAGSLMFIPHLIYAARIIQSGYSEFMTNEAIWSIFSFIIMSSSLVLTYRWFKPMNVKRFEVNMKNLFILFFATYSLTLVWINSYFLVFYTPIFTPLRLLNFTYLSRYLQTFILILKIVSGFILLKLSSNILRKPVLNEENTKLASLALGGMSLAGLTIALDDVMDPRFPLHDSMEIAFRYVVPLVILFTILGLLAYDVFTQRRARYRTGAIALYLALATALFDYIGSFFRRIVWRVDLQRLLRFLARGSYLTSTLDLPAPGLVATVLVVIGIVMHKLGLGTSSRLKTIYSIAIISSGFVNIYSGRRLPIFLNLYLGDVGNLINFEATSLYPKIPNYGLWECLISIFNGFIILAFGVLCLREPRIKIDEERTHRVDWD